MNIIAPSPSLDGRSYVHIEWPRQLLPPPTLHLYHYICITTFISIHCCIELGLHKKHCNALDCINYIHHKTLHRLSSHFNLLQNVFKQCHCIEREELLPETDQDQSASASLAPLPACLANGSKSHHNYVKLFLKC